MRKLFGALLFLLASVTAVQAQYYPSLSLQANPPDPEVACWDGAPLYIVSTKEVCTCNTVSTEWMCELATVDKLIFGGLDVNDGVFCLTNSEIEGRAFLDISPCVPSDTPSVPRFLVPPKYLEADIPICDAALEGLRVYLLPEVGVTAGRYASCVGRMDGSGFDWILGYELGNTEAPL